MRAKTRISTDFDPSIAVDIEIAAKSNAQTMMEIVRRAVMLWLGVNEVNGPNTVLVLIDKTSGTVVKRFEP